MVKMMRIVDDHWEAVMNFSSLLRLIAEEGQRQRRDRETSIYPSIYLASLSTLFEYIKKKK